MSKPYPIKPIQQPANKKRKKLRIREPKIDPRDWNVDPRRIQQDLGL